MKTAISLPDDLFREVEACSRRLKVSRSALFAAAVREYLARHAGAGDATEDWNRVAVEMARSGDDRFSGAMRRRSKAVVGATLRPRA